MAPGALPHGPSPYRVPPLRALPTGALPPLSPTLCPSCRAPLPRGPTGCGSRGLPQEVNGAEHRLLPGCPLLPLPPPTAPQPLLLVATCRGRETRQGQEMRGRCPCPQHGSPSSSTSALSPGPHPNPTTTKGATRKRSKQNKSGAQRHPTEDVAEADSRGPESGDQELNKRLESWGAGGPASQGPAHQA